MRHIVRSARNAGRRARTLPILFVFCGVVMTMAREPRSSVETAHLQAQPTQASQTSSGQGDEQQARATCGGCHAFPPPDILPRQEWRDEFVRMMFIREKRLPPPGPPSTVNRTVQLPPDMAKALEYYTSRAPE